MPRVVWCVQMSGTTARSSGAKSKWTTDGEVVDGQVRWQHPSGAETLLVTTLSDVTRRKALSRTLRRHMDPAAVNAARRADSRAKAQKRARETTWRDDERVADAKAKAKKREDDPEWRDLERDIERHAKRQEKHAPQPARNELFNKLLTAARITPYDEVFRYAASGALIPLLQPLDLPAAEWVEMLALMCARYKTFVEAHGRREPNASVPEEWQASLVYDLKRNGRRLTADEASRLENACDDWKFDNAPNMDPDLAKQLLIADEMVEKCTREIPAYGKELRAALKAARAGYEPDVCDELQLLMQRSTEEEEAAAKAAAASRAEAVKEAAANKAREQAERRRAQEQFEQEEARRQQAQAELEAQQRAQCAELERPTNERRWTELQSSVLARNAAPGSMAVAATMHVATGRNPESIHYEIHRTLGDHRPGSQGNRFKPRTIVPDFIPHVRLQLEAFRVAGGQETEPCIWRTPGCSPSYSADGSFTTRYLMHGTDQHVGKGMCISDPNLDLYSRDPCPFCKRDNEALAAPRKSFSQALQCEAEERRKRRKVKGPVRVSVSLYTGGFCLVGLILQVRR